MIVQLGHPPQRIDIVTQLDGVEFGRCWDRHIEIKISGRRVPFISVDDLLANKKASGRPQDLADVAAIEDLSDADDERQTR